MRHPKPVKGAKKKRSTISKRNKNRKATARQCDILAGQLVRARGICEAAGNAVSVNADGERLQCSGPLQWAHIISRRYRSVRWRLDNAFCLCAGHHMFFTWRPVEWELFVLGKGVNYVVLKGLALIPFHKNLDAIMDYLRIEAAKVEGAPVKA